MFSTDGSICSDRNSLYMLLNHLKLKSMYSFLLEISCIYSFEFRARSDELGSFAKYLHAFVSVFQNKCHLKSFNCLSILRTGYNPMKIVTVDCKACNFGKEVGGKLCSCERPLTK